MQAKKIVAASAQVTTGATTANVALPVDSAGGSPKFVLISAAGPAFIAFGRTGVTVAAATGIRIPADEPTCFDVSGCTHMAHIQSGAAATINISPVEA